MSDLLTMDAPTDNIYLALIQCFAIILCGYAAGRLDIITRSEANGLNTFVGTFALPSLIFLSLAKLDFSLVNWRFLLAVFLAKSSVFFVVLAISMITTRASNPGRAALFAIFSTQSNDFAIGYPMIDALYGDTHPEYSAYLYLMAPISLAILNPIGFVLLEIGKRRASHQTGGRWSLIWSVVKGIALNPILFMTVLGIVGNLVSGHQIPKFISSILEVLGNAFSASALFLLGLMMVGKVHTLKGVALVIPGILICIKLLVLPLVIRESVILLDAGVNETDTRDLSTYGFLYGTIPTAPALFIFTLRYNLDIDLIASSMVACTFLSAPLMFVSAKLITALNDGVSPANYGRQLNTFSLDTSTASTAACIWLLICFIGLEGKKYKRVTHWCTLCIVIAQVAVSIGVIIWTKLDPSSTGSLLWYIQFILITGGVYASRVWTATLAASLLFLSSRSLPFVQNLQKWLFFIAWGVPLLIVTIICVTVMPKPPADLDLRNPNFQLGRVQAAVSILVLLFCFIVTLGCLILNQRYQRRHSAAAHAALLSQPENSEPPLVESRNVVDVEDLLSPTPNLPNNGNCGLDGACGFPRGFCAATNGILESEENLLPDTEPSTNELDDPQILRHLVFLILLLCSMFIGLSLSIGTLIMEQLTGVYAELAFLDVALNFGQSLIAFAIFGLDPGLGRIGESIKKLCQQWKEDIVPLSGYDRPIRSFVYEHKIRESSHIPSFLVQNEFSKTQLKIYEEFLASRQLQERQLIASHVTKNGARELKLPDEDALSTEARIIRDQFKQCHLTECRSRIAMCRRRLLKVYQGAFSGSDLVDWLIEAGVAQSREEAVRYGRCLLESRVLHHIDGTQHFQDRNLLYTFRA